MRARIERMFDIERVASTYVQAYELIRCRRHDELGRISVERVAPADLACTGALSFLPGSLGVTEGAMTVLLVHGAARADRSVALDATLLTRLATLWFAVVLGLGCLVLARHRIRAHWSRARTRFRGFVSGDREDPAASFVTATLSVDEHAGRCRRGTS